MATDETRPQNNIANDGEIGAEEEQAIEESLFLYFSGREHLISDALTNTKGISVGTYYKRRKEFPDQVLRIRKRARDRAREFIAGQRQALDAEAVQASREMQWQARDGLLRSLDCIIAIASGETRTIDLGETDRDGSPKRKEVVAYPRDITAAGKLLHEIARGVCLPEGKLALPLLSARTEEPEEKPYIHVLGVRTGFRRVSATAADGTTYTAVVEPGEVTDVEAQECCWVLRGDSEKSVRTRDAREPPPTVAGAFRRPCSILAQSLPLSPVLGVLAAVHFCPPGWFCISEFIAVY